MPEHAARKATAGTIVPLQRSKASAQETAMIVEQSYVAASKGAVEFNLKLIDIAEDNVNAGFDFARQLPHGLQIRRGYHSRDALRLFDEPHTQLVPRTHPCPGVGVL
jgi:hypothetical protein